MPRLKDRNLEIPGGAQILHPDAGMSKPFKGSFFDCVTFEQSFRQKNPFLCKKHGWTLDPFEIEEWVEQQQVARCLAHNWHAYLDTSPVSPPNWNRQPPPSRGVLADVAEAEPRIAVSIQLVMDWLGEDLIPVDAERAEKRAVVCAGCPLNQDGEPSEDSRKLLSLRTNFALRTSRDVHLKTCRAFRKHAGLLIWSKRNPIAIDEPDPACWVLKELNGQP